ncbi:MAG: hypothetical protein WC878_07750 [Candidatus Paceibacterota bacterium]|jgi:hypothetical protein
MMIFPLRWAVFRGDFSPFTLSFLLPIQKRTSATESILDSENVRGPWSMGIKVDVEKLPQIPFTAEKPAQAKECGLYFKYQMHDDAMIAS